MLMKQHSAPVRALRYGLVLPLAGLFILLFQQAPVIAQEVKGKSGTPDQQVQATQQSNDNPCDQEPAFPGGIDALIAFMTKNLQYPKSAGSSIEAATVVVSFTVKEDGSVNNAYVKEPSEMPAAFNAEALRVVSMLPTWTPGKKNCKPGTFELCIPIKFKLDGKSDLKANETAHVKTGNALELYEIDNPPYFPGGDAALKQYLAENIKYPATARKEKAEGLAVVEFTVEKNGSITEIKTVGSTNTHPDILAEAKRVAEAMPKWVPAVLDGEIVRVRYTLPVRFKLD